MIVHVPRGDFRRRLLAIVLLFDVLQGLVYHPGRDGQILLGVPECHVPVMIGLDEQACAD